MANESEIAVPNKTINMVIDIIVKTVEYEEKYAEKNSDMNDPYYMGYVDALDYIAAFINSIKSKEK